MKKSRVKITERGWAGHFICSFTCAFRRNTLIEYGDKRIVVSTVGNMRFRDNEQQVDTIGHNRYYETMAFEAYKAGSYWEADVQKEVAFDSEWAISEEPVEGTDEKAQQMHEAVVKELSKKIKED